MTSVQVEIRDAQGDDLRWIAQLVRASFAESMLPYLVAAQSGIVAWWRLIVEHPRSFDNIKILVATAPDGEPLGYAEFKQLGPETAALSYVAVDPAARGRRVAARLIGAFCRAHPGVRILELDVFDTNDTAKLLYARLGFEEVRRTIWWQAPLDVAVDQRATIAVADLPAAMARHEVFGFTDFDVDVAGSTRRYGVLGEDVLRCFTAETFDHSTDHSALKELFPLLSRRLVLLPSTRKFASEHAAALVESVRMRSVDAARLRAYQ